jgi:hypothetical protein
MLSVRVFHCRLEELVVVASKGGMYQLAKQFGQQLIDNTREVIGMPPVSKDGESYNSI